jgi:hypothetical protein
MIDSRSLTGLSLSHFEQTHNDQVPLEVSLCKTPARPGCYITAYNLPTSSAIMAYKAFDQAFAKPTLSALITMSEAKQAKAAAAPAAGSDEQITSTLKEMTESQRNLVSAALDAMQKRLDAAEARASDMSTENETLKNAQQVDKALLESQIKSFITQVGEKHSAQFGLTEESCKTALASDSPGTIRHNVERMLLCCNTAMIAMHQRKAAPTMSVDREALSEPAADADTAVPVSTGASSQKRKAEHFEPTEEDAATRLRNIMSTF